MANLITSSIAVQNENAIYVFKKTVAVKTLCASMLNIFAESRYKLYINGQLCAVGPCRRSSEVPYYDSVDVTPYFKQGENEIVIYVAQLMQRPPEKDDFFPLESVMRDGSLALCVWGNVGETEVTTDESWLCAKENGTEICFERGIRGYNAVQFYERISADYGKNLGFKAAVVGDSIYDLDTETGNSLTIARPLKKRPIPMMYFDKKDFVSAQDGVYDAGYETCGYVRLRASGKGTIKLAYAECKVFPDETGMTYKRQRDAADGEIHGDRDTIAVDGEIYFEPYWMRTFRYIKIETEGDVCVDGFDYLETGYPFDVQDGYDFGSDIDNRVFSVSVNTLKRCMHETYVDCPYYEQLQYTMDTFQQMLFTYQLTMDRALPEKAIDDFAASYRVGGLTQSRFPTVTPQYIPGFSLFFIYMLYEHARRFSDKKFIRKYLHIADGILDWFTTRLDGYMVSRSNLWDFLDWPDEYDRGMPPEHAPLTVYSLMFADALEKTTYMHSLLGNSVPGYAELANKVKADVKARCYDADKKLYGDTPLKGHFSQHQQIWAVLCGMETGEDARRLLARAETLSCKCTIAYAYYLYRAYELAGQCEKIDAHLDIYRKLVQLGCTTMPEKEFETVRSECHAWSAIALYEFTARVLGVTHADGKIYVKPYIGTRPYAKGKVATPAGFVSVSWKNENGAFVLDLKLPEGEVAVLTLPDGSEIDAQSGVYTVNL